MPTVSFKVHQKHGKDVVILDWVDADGYFGEIILVNFNGKTSLYTETLGKETAKSLFCQLIDEAELKE